MDTDLAVLKDTKLVENVGLQFRAEFFNIFNHTNLGLPIAGLGGSALFTDAEGDRIGSAAQIRSMVGTPRQIQFALKLIFEKRRRSVLLQADARQLQSTRFGHQK